jgi:hypothetical protein
MTAKAAAGEESVLVRAMERSDSDVAKEKNLTFFLFHPLFTTLSRDDVHSLQDAQPHENGRGNCLKTAPVSNRK